MKILEGVVKHHGYQIIIGIISVPEYMPKCKLGIGKSVFIKL